MNLDFDVASVNVVIQRSSVRWARRTKLDAADIAQECWLLFLSSISRYDPDRGAITTFCYHVINRRIMRYVATEHKHRVLDEGPERDASMISQFDVVSGKDTIVRAASRCAAVGELLASVIGHDRGTSSRQTSYNRRSTARSILMEEIDR
jgi:DNA-directed RNA polymerase specialized sigma24 family protein